MKKYTTVIEITNLWLKLVAAKPSLKNPEIVTAVVKPIAALNPEIISQELSTLIKKINFTPSPLIVCLARNLVTMRNLHLPSRDHREIEGMVDLHMAKQVPYPREEIIGSYQILGPDEAGYTSVILAIVHREALSQIFDALNKISLFPEKIELSSQGVFNWFLFSQKGHLEPEKIYILLDVDSNFTDFMIVNREQLLFSRSIACGSEQISNEEIRRTKFISELKQSLVIFESEEMNKKPAKIFISGAIENSGGLKKFLEDELNIGVEIIRPSLNIGGEIPGGVSISAVLGLALDTSRQRINFVLPEVQIRKTLKERSRDLILLGSLLMFILALSGGIFLAKVSNRTGYLKLLDQRFGEIRKNVEELDIMAKKIRIIRERLNTRILSLDYLYQIHKLIPAEITLKMITFEVDNKITLRGQAQELSDALKFIATLDNSSYFKDIQTKYTSKKRVAERDVSEFEIICPMVIGKK